MAILQKLFQDLDRRINARFYFMSGGYLRFQRDKKALVEQYRKLPGKGMKAETALRDFLQEREYMGKKVLKDDLEITLALIVSCLSIVKASMGSENLVHYACASLIYLRPGSSSWSGQDALISVTYTILTPLLNPMIYTLRNKDVKAALCKAIRKTQISAECFPGKRSR
uniref:Guanylate-binding protein/Atlastin C-terminal domain-containing protein n=1 Tax=Anas platyrhynchos TaxID=8839 RepID=A0A8B9T8Z2_ANAPL